MMLKPLTKDPRSFGLVLVVAVQALCTLFFLSDVVADGVSPDPGERDADFWLELAASVGLLLGVVFGAREARRALSRARKAEAALSAASGAFMAFVESRFSAWALTQAERDVALFTLKGFDVAEIAGFRGAAASTVRAQLAKIYAKAGVSGRGQLVSLFIDDLLSAPQGATVLTGQSDDGITERSR